MKILEEQIAVMQHFADGGEVEFCAGANWLDCADPSWNWQLFDYRIKQLVDPYAELKTAAADPTKQIRLLDENGQGKHSRWYDAGYEWQFCFPPKDYEIRDKLKKVKLLAWFDGVNLLWRAEECPLLETLWKRVPSEDKVVEVEE